MSAVSFVDVAKQSGSQLKDAIAESLRLIGYSFPGNLRNVAIKANMCYYWDFSTGQTTDPKFISALIDVIREQTSPDVNFSIVESDASAMRCSHAYKLLGYEQLLEKKGVRLVNLSEDQGDEVDVSVRGENLKFKLPETIRTADLRINVPKIKFMPQTTISCAMKNIFGCNPQTKKYKYHPKINEVIVGLNKLMKFDLCVLDGIVACGNPTTRLNLVMASKDPVAFDSAVAKIVGVNPKKVKHLVLAQHEGIGTMDFAPKGESLQIFSKKYPRRKTSTKVLLFGYKVALKTHLLNPNYF
jgi:uncharacterized protein (DUF362 family)